MWPATLPVYPCRLSRAGRKPCQAVDTAPLCLPCESATRRRPCPVTFPVAACLVSGCVSHLLALCRVNYPLLMHTVYQFTDRLQACDFPHVTSRFAASIGQDVSKFVTSTATECHFTLSATRVPSEDGTLRRWY